MAVTRACHRNWPVPVFEAETGIGRFHFAPPPNTGRGLPVLSRPPGGTSWCMAGDERPCPRAADRGSLMHMRESSQEDPAVRAAVEEVRRLEARVDALTEAVEVLARGLEESPMAEPGDNNPAEAARRARELLLLANRGRPEG